MRTTMPRRRPSPAEVHANVVTLGRAYVRLVEAADLLLERQMAWAERLLLRFVRFMYTYRLRGLIEALPPT